MRPLSRGLRRPPALRPHLALNRPPAWCTGMSAHIGRRSIRLHIMPEYDYPQIPLGRKKPLLNPLLPRCRRKRQFIVTFLCPQLYDPVPRCLYRPYHSISSKKVPTKMTFNRHLLVVSAESTFRRKSALHSFRRSRVSPAIPHSFRRGMGRSSSLQALESHFRRKSIQHSFRRSRVSPSFPHSFRRSE